MIGQASELPLWKLGLVALPSMTITFMFSVTLPHAGPYMMRLGMVPALATLNNLAGPITGFFTDPIVGGFSDSLTSPYGRRRPVIVFGLVLMIATMVAFSQSESLLPAGKAAFLAAPMFWILDISINMCMTPMRALLADLATSAHQVPLQAIVVCYQAAGGIVAFTVMRSYDVPSEHLFELMALGCAVNCVAVAIQCHIAQETPLVREGEDAQSARCLPIAEVWQALKSSSALLRRVSALLFLSFVGIGAWQVYTNQWVGICVYQGDPAAREGSHEHNEYAMGQEIFVYGGQCKSILQLLLSLVMTFVLKRDFVPARHVLALTLFVGAVVSGVAAFTPTHNGSMAVVCIALSVIPYVGAMSIPFGLIAAQGELTEQEGGGRVGTALQMGLMNCALTLGQQLTTLILAFLEGQMSASKALPVAFLVAAASLAVGTVWAALLDTCHATSERSEDSLEDWGPDGSLLPFEAASASKPARPNRNKDIASSSGL